MSSASLSEVRAQLDELVQRSALYLDEGRFGEFLDLTSEDFHYVVEAYSPELKKGMTWLEHDRAGLAALIELLPKHHRNGASWLRQVVLGTVNRSAGTAGERELAHDFSHRLRHRRRARRSGRHAALLPWGATTIDFAKNETAGSSSSAECGFRRELGVGSHQFP